MLHVQWLAALIEQVKNVFDVNRTGNMKPQELMIGGEPVSLETHLLLPWIKQAQAPQHYPQTRVQLRASVYYVHCVAALIWKVKNVFDVNKTGNMKPQELLTGGVPVTLETQSLSP